MKRLEVRVPLVKKSAMLSNGGDEGDTDLHVFDEFANKEVTTLDMLETSVVLRVVRHVASALRVSTHCPLSMVRGATGKSAISGRPIE